MSRALQHQGHCPICYFQRGHALATLVHYCALHTIEVANDLE